MHAAQVTGCVLRRGAGRAGSCWACLHQELWMGESREWV